MEYVVEMKNITKRFGDFKALDDVSFVLKQGAIHALLGENGAGKSTLMSVLFGLYTAEEGNIRINEKDVEIRNPNDANDLGIGMVHQHFKLVNNFTVLENIVLGHETTKNGFLHMENARERIIALSERYQFAIDPDMKISDITVGMQQRVEILKMLYSDNEILIFDEPTAVLTPQEIDELMEIMRQLVKEGKSIIFITHKLKEIMAVADSVTVLRKGSCVGTIEVKDATPEILSEMMVGRAVDFLLDKEESKTKEVVLDIQELSMRRPFSDKALVNNVSFQVRQGEILCIAGVDGNGQSELVYGITGINPIEEGRIYLNGKDITQSSIRERCLAGISHIPEDRQKFGLVLDYSLKQNLVLQSYYLPQFQTKGFIRFDQVEEYAEELSERFDIRSSEGAESMVRSMSGGNQQKAILARELDRGSDLVIAVQPVRGLDVGAIEYIHGQLLAQRDAGKAVLLISFDLDEVMNLSDRILVMYEGEIVGELDPKETDSRELGLYMAGQKKEQAV